MKHVIFLVLLIVLSSCWIFKRVEGLLDQQDSHYWEGYDSNVSYQLDIDSSSGIWYYGRLTVNQKDTLRLSGFEKGSNHPTQIDKINSTDSNIVSLGRVFIYAHGWKADSVELINDRSTYLVSMLPESIIMIKKEKNSNTKKKQQRAKRTTGN